MANFNVTLPGQYITPLINPEQKNDYTVRYVVPYTVLSTAGSSGATDTVTLTLGSTPANWVVSGVYAYLTPVYAGTTGGLSVAIGTTGTSTAFLNTVSVLSGSLLQPSTGINTTNTIASSFGTATTSIVALFTNSVSGGMNGLTSGSMEILLSVNDLTQVY